MRLYTDAAQDKAMIEWGHLAIPYTLFRVHEEN